MSREIFSKDPEKYNKVLAEALKKIPEFEIPEWSLYVKSGVSKERVPADQDFWYKRVASILRQLYIHGVVGVERLRNRYGSRKARGVKPSKHKKSSGKMIRVMLQQAEKAGFVEKLDKIQFGRRLSEEGRKFLDSIKIKEEQDGKETQHKE
jgi:small subunit ribosomal protein S19e